MSVRAFSLEMLCSELADLYTMGQMRPLSPLETIYYRALQDEYRRRAGEGR